jgi:hypothetical protein
VVRGGKTQNARRAFTASGRNFRSSTFLYHDGLPNANLVMNRMLTGNFANLTLGTLPPPNAKRPAGFQAFRAQSLILTSQVP